MAIEPKLDGRSGIIAHVTTPIAFFTLVVLVLEAALGTIAVSTTGMDRTIAIVGMLGGLVLVVGMVFVLTRRPQYRGALLGIADHSPALAIDRMNLSQNDLRALYSAHSMYGRLSEENASKFLGRDPISSWGERLRKLQRLGLSKAHPRSMGILTEEGAALGKFLEHAYQSLKDVGPTGPPDPRLTAPLESEIARLRLQCSQLAEKIEDMTKLRSLIIASLGAGQSKPITTLIADLGAYDADKEKALRSQVGLLVEEGLVGHDDLRPEGYYKLLKKA
jgi:hypothetical protein